MKSDKKEKIIANLSMKIVYLSLTMLALMLILIIYYFWEPTPPQKPQEFICGNASEADSRRDKIINKYGNGMDFDRGEKLFKQNCAVCHSQSNNIVSGPGMEGVMARVPSEKWLFAYILHSDSLYKAKDPYTLKLHAEYPDERMPDFKRLTAKDIAAIVLYLSENRGT